MKGICKHYGEEFDCCKLLSDFSNPMTDLRPCTKDEHECKYYKPHTNFDRITESAEAFADWIFKSYTNVPENVPCAVENCETTNRMDCKKCFIKWLQKECKE